MQENKTPLFSIITVTYQAQETLFRTLESVAGQSFRDFEQLIVDGASTDNTSAIAARFADLPGFRFVSEPDGGLYDAMNKSIALARGTFLIFLNAGDRLHDALVLERVAAIVQRVPTADILYGETALVDEDGCFIGMRRLKAPRHLSWRSFRQGMLVSHQAFWVRREIAEPYNLAYRFSADVDWCIRAMKRARVLVNCDRVLVDYLNEGLTTRNHKASLKERFRIMTHYYGFFPVAFNHVWFAVRFFYAKLFRGWA